MLASLTRRAKKIAWLVVEGHSNMEMAQQLGVCERTIKTHLTKIFRKLGVTNRTQLALLVLRAQYPLRSPQEESVPDRQGGSNTKV